MYDTIPFFYGFDDQENYKDWENHFQIFFRYFDPLLAQKCRYVQYKLSRKVYIWSKDSNYV